MKPKIMLPLVAKALADQMEFDAWELRKAVLRKELLDEAFYLANYGERIPPDEPAIDHFVRIGRRLGFAPCAAFDPVLHEVLHGPTSPSDWPDRIQTEGWKPNVAELFPELDFQIYHWRSKSADDLKDNVGQIVDNPTRSVRFPTPYGIYKFRNPASEVVFDAIRAGKPFSFVRIPHGFWDCCNAVDRVTTDLADDPRAQALSEQQRRSLAIRLLGSLSPENGNFGGDYLDTILDDLRQHPRDPDLLTGIAFKGAPTYEDSAFGLGRIGLGQLTRALKFMELFSPQERLYDAMVWKRWALLGGLKDLPEVLRDRPLILVARQSFEVLAERLDLPHLVLVDIPETRTQLIRREVLARIEAALQEQIDRHPGRTPVVLFQSGASLGYWFILRLRSKFPEAIYLDIGEALNIWCIDRAGVNLWLGPYIEQISKACHLAPSGAV